MSCMLLIDSHRFNGALAPANWMAIMAAERRIIQQEKPSDHPLEALTSKLIKERPAFQGAPEPEALLTRSHTADNLIRAGFPVSAKTLATKASRGGGPPYSLFGARPLYRWRDALAWAYSRLTSPRRSSSEGDVAPPQFSEDSNITLAMRDSDCEVQGLPDQTQNKTLGSEGPISSSRRVRGR